MAVDVQYVLKYGDPRLKSIPLTQTPFYTIIVVLIYLFFVTIFGPQWMRNRKPYQIRKLLIAYNVSMVAVSTWMFIRFAGLYFIKYSWRCEPIDFSENEDALKALYTCYVCYLSKLVELLDTVFFVLRKKYNQITFLHVFHHALLPITAWYGTKYGGGGYAIISPMVNAFVHIWMYFYYGLSAIGPSVQKYLWWKQYLTTLQLIQFCVVMTVIGQLLLFPPNNCNETSFIISLTMGQAMIFFALFMRFYKTSYKNKNSKQIKNNL